jgi:microcystin-dependent protein
MSVEYTYILNTCGNINIIDPAINNFTGMVAYFAMAQNPDGWLICDGSTLNRFTYPNLFARIQYIYGGSGTYFKIPDLRGYFIRSWNWTGGVDPDPRSLGSFQDHALQQHQHIMNWGTRAVASGGGSCWTGGANDSGNVLNANTSTETRPINKCLQACIKY